MRVILEKLRDFAKAAAELRNENKQETVLRHNLSAWIPQIFSTIPAWFRDHITGTEEGVEFLSKTGSNRGFVDALVGKTVIEYEKDLRISSVYKHGKEQVYDYCAGELNKASDVEDIIGILSDTVEWYAYRVEIDHMPEGGKLYGRDNLQLVEIDYVCLDSNEDSTLIYWTEFMDRYLGRIGARYLNAVVLARDLGIESIYSKENIQRITSVVDRAFGKRPQYAEMIKGLWMSFVSLIGGGVGNFSILSYSNELYIITLAKILCANIVVGKGLVSSDEELVAILNGGFFAAKGFLNFVEYDYFGWINDTPYVTELIVVGRNLQQMLIVYDYKNMKPEDLFGRLVSQLAHREQRILLGQEETPQWLAGKMVSRILDDLKGEMPHFIDMCCGSGVFLVETLRQTEELFGINADSPQMKIKELTQAILGFDADPLAVMLSRANWLIIMRKYVPYIETDGFIIPVFHADSLFTKTPITEEISMNYEEKIHKLNFGGKTVVIPGQLLFPCNRRVFTYMIKQCHCIADKRAEQDAENLCEAFLEPIVRGAALEMVSSVNKKMMKELEEFAGELVEILEKLQRKGMNGIWEFILNNTYRPALVRNQFNGIISNPPWLAMSKLKNNPYKKQLSERAKLLEIKPIGSAKPHLELATVFMIQAVKHYLRYDSVFACIVPQSI